MTRVLYCPVFKTRAIADIERRERLSPVRAILGSELVRVRIRKGSQKQEWAKLLKVGLLQGEATQEDKGKGKHREETQMCERRASLRVRGGEAGQKATNTLDCRPRKPRLPIEGRTCSQADGQGPSYLPSRHCWGHNVLRAPRNRQRVSVQWDMDVF